MLSDKVGCGPVPRVLTYHTLQQSVVVKIGKHDMDTINEKAIINSHVYTCLFFLVFLL